MKADVEQMISQWQFPSRVSLLLDYPPGFAVEILSLLQPPVVVITASSSPYYLQDLLDFQPAGLLLEPAEPAHLQAALTLASSGQNAGYPTIPKDQRLTARERQVLRLLVRGYSDKEIARELDIEPKTVSHWVMSIRGKMGARDRTQAVLMYWGHPTGSSKP